MVTAEILRIEGYLTVPQVARRYGVCEETVRRARRTGRFPGAQFEFGRWLVPNGAAEAVYGADSADSG